MSSPQHLPGRRVSAHTYSHLGCRCDGCRDAKWRQDNRGKKRPRQASWRRRHPGPDGWMNARADWVAFLRAEGIIR